MKKVMIIGAGGVGAVVAHKCAQTPDVFERDSAREPHRLTSPGRRGGGERKAAP